MTNKRTRWHNGKIVKKSSELRSNSAGESIIKSGWAIGKERESESTWEADQESLRRRLLSQISEFYKWLVIVLSFVRPKSEEKRERKERLIVTGNIND